MTSRAEKRRQKMTANPKDWRFDDVKAMLEGYGFRMTAGSGGSHRMFKHERGLRVNIPDSGSGTLLPVYVKNALAEVEKLEALE